MRIAGLLASCCLLAGSILPAAPSSASATAAQPAPAPPPCPRTPATAPGLPPLTAGAWLVADLDTGAVLTDCQPHAQAPPASTIKLLTAVTVTPKLNPQSTITVTEEDLHFEPGSSAVGLVHGGTYSVETLLLGMLLNSGNDAANVLARAGGGSGGVPATIESMNATAAELGAKETHAINPHGLDAPGQVTSVTDLALIMRAALDNPLLARYLTTIKAGVPPQTAPEPDRDGFEIQSDNRLLFDYPGALGGKTGFTDAARHTYVGAAERNGRRLVVSLLQAERAPASAPAQAMTLLDWGFALDPNVPAVGSLHPANAPQAESTSKSAAPPIHRNPRVLLAGLLTGVLTLVLVGLLLRRCRSGSDGSPPTTPSNRANLVRVAD